jgi:hypothetical protein
MREHFGLRLICIDTLSLVMIHLSSRPFHRVVPSLEAIPSLPETQAIARCAEDQGKPSQAPPSHEIVKVVGHYC